MNQYYKVVITETGRNTLKEQAHTFNVETKSFRTLEGAEAYLFDRYGTIPKRTTRNTIYQDTENEAEEIGFTKSYWNKDMSHNSNSWYQTDWVTITEVKEKPVLIS